MNDFLGQFGIDWKLFVSQLVNFALILLILWFFVYKPLIKILNKRQDKIKDGLAKAEEASIRLKEVDVMSKNKLQETDEKCVSIIASTDDKRREIEAEIIEKAKEKEVDLIKKAEAYAESQKQQMYKKIEEEASSLIKSAIAKGVNLKPDQVDEELIKKSVSALKNEL